MLGIVQGMVLQGRGLCDHYVFYDFTECVNYSFHFKEYPADMNLQDKKILSKHA